MTTFTNGLKNINLDRNINLLLLLMALHDDMKRFFSKQCELCTIPISEYARKWINLRKLYRNIYKVKEGTLKDIVKKLGLKFEGRLHCGIDDARNVARALQKMVEDGCEIKFKENMNDNT